MPDVWFRTLEGALLRCTVPDKCTKEQLCEALGQRVGDPHMPGVRLFTRGEQIKPQQSVTLEQDQVILVVLSMQLMLKDTLAATFDRPPYVTTAMESKCEDELVRTCTYALGDLRERADEFRDVEIEDFEGNSALPNITGACAYYAAVLGAIASSDSDQASAATTALSGIGSIIGDGAFYVDMSSGAPSLVPAAGGGGGMRIPRPPRPGSAAGIAERLAMLMETVEEERARRGLVPAQGQQQGQQQLPEVPGALVEQMVSVLGCDEARARRALQLTRCNPDDALNLLLDDDPRLASDDDVLRALGGGRGGYGGDVDEIHQALQFMQRHPDTQQVIMNPRLNDALAAVTSGRRVDDDPELAELVQVINAVIQAV